MGSGTVCMWLLKSHTDTHARTMAASLQQLCLVFSYDVFLVILICELRPIYNDYRQVRLRSETQHAKRRLYTA